MTDDTYPTTGLIECVADDPCMNPTHALVGQNVVKRPVWECQSCGTQRVGPFPGSLALRKQFASDGGKR